MYDLLIGWDWAHCTRCGCHTMHQIETHVMRGIVVGYDAYCFGCGWGRTWVMGGQGIVVRPPDYHMVIAVMNGR